MERDDLKVKEENGALIISGDVNSVQEKELLLNKIQQVNLENAMDMDFQLGVKG